MAFGAQERRELRRLLREFGAAYGHASIPGGPGKALEVWVLMRMARKAKKKGWSVSLRRGDGSPLPTGRKFRFRTQPGKIAASSPSAIGYVQLVPKKPKETELELHGGLQWVGRSTARHECDISVLPSTVGRPLRAGGGGYPRGLPIVALECKDKEPSGSPDEMRQMVARLFDLVCIKQVKDGSPDRIFSVPTTVGWGDRASMYRAFFAKGQFGIVRATDFGLGANLLSNHYKISRYGNIYDRGKRSIAALLNRFGQVLEQLP